MKDDLRKRYEAILRRTISEASVTPRAESLQAIFSSLGIARVTRVARALYVDGGGGYDCFHAHGQAGLHGRMIDHLTTSYSARGISGLSEEEVDTLIHHFTYESEHFISELVQWLRARGADATTVLALAACEVDAERRGDGIS